MDLQIFMHLPLKQKRKKENPRVHHLSKQNSFKSPKRLVITQTKQNLKKKKKKTKTLEPVMIIMMIWVSCHGMPWLWIVVKHGMVIMVVVPVAWRLQLTCVISVR